MPSELLNQRPDIRQAEAQLASSNFSVEAARAAFFPQIQLTAQTGVQSAALASLFGPGAWFYTLSAGTDAAAVRRLPAGEPVEAGEGRAAAESAGLSQGGALGLRRRREGAGCAVANSTLQERLQAEAVATSRKAFEVSETQLRARHGQLITVLQTQQTLLTTENTLVQVRLNKLLAASSLFQALGGGWTPGGTLASLQTSGQN